MNSEPKKEFFVKCPRCGLSALYSSKNPYRPFCSDRCKIIDLGAWAEGKYAIPVQEMNYDERLYDQDADSQESSAEDSQQATKQLKDKEKK